MAKEKKFILQSTDGFYTQSSDGYLQGFSDIPRNAALYDTREEAETAVRNLQYGGDFWIVEIFIERGW
jgi:hypothetical protein